MLVIGLTGGIGSGKTTVAQLFSEFGVDIIDTDEIAHDLVRKGEPALELLVDEFGPHILQEDGALNRSKLRDIIFNDEEKRISLEHILHPLIRTQTSQQLRESRLAKKAPYAMVVIPLLVDNGDWIAIDRILVVDCEDEVQIERVMQRDQQTKEQVVAVMNAQIDREERLLAADDIINNDVNPELLEQTVLDLHRKYLEMAENINYAE